MSLLKISQLKAAYGPVPALFGVNLEISDREVVALMGRNGMGKSTTVKAICGMIESQGELRFKDHDLHQLPSYRIGQLGIGLVPEGRRCFRDLTVVENLIAASRPGHWNIETVIELFPKLGERLSQRASSLSGGEQQMLAIARALMTNPSLLILDEATEGLAPLVRQQIWIAIQKIKDGGDMAILLIDKSLKELALVADRFVIIERGQTVWSGPLAQLDPEITATYLGV